MGGRIDAVFFCPHSARRRLRLPQAAAGPVRADRRALRRRPAAACRSVGDSLRDLQAGVAVGCEPHLVLTGKGAGLPTASRCPRRYPPGTRGARRPGRVRRLPDRSARRAPPPRLKATRMPRLHGRSCASLRSRARGCWSPWSPGASAWCSSSIWCSGDADVLDGARAGCGWRSGGARVHLRRAAARARAWRTCRRRDQPGDPAGQAPVDAGRPSACPTLMPHPLAYVFKRELLYIPFFGWAMARLDMIHIDRSQRAAGLQQGGRAGQAPAGAGHLGHHVPRRHAHPARPEGHLQDRRHAAGRRHRRAGGPDRRDLGQVLAAQGLHQAPGRGRRLDRQADPQRGPRSPTN